MAAVPLHFMSFGGAMDGAQPSANGAQPSANGALPSASEGQPSAGGALPLVILHGLLGASENWRSIAERLSVSFPVYVPDLRNHGESPHTSDASYAAMAEDVIAFLDHRGLGPVTLIGHSMGGKVAMAAALSNPTRINKLIIADIGPEAHSPYLLSAMDALSRLDTAALTSRGEAERLLADTIPDRSVRLFVLKNLKRSGEKGFTWRANIPALTAAYPYLCGAVGGLGRHDGPVLFLKGEQSPYLRDSEMPRIRELFPKAKLKVIPSAGHWLHADNPKAFLDEVVRFCNT